MVITKRIPVAFDVVTNLHRRLTKRVTLSVWMHLITRLQTDARGTTSNEIYYPLYTELRKER